MRIIILIPENLDDVLLGVARPRHLHVIVRSVSVLGITPKQSPKLTYSQLSHQSGQRPSLLQGSLEEALDRFALGHKPLSETIAVVQELVGVSGQAKEV